MRQNLSKSASTCWILDVQVFEEHTEVVETDRTQVPKEDHTVVALLTLGESNPGIGHSLRSIRSTARRPMYAAYIASARETRTRNAGAALNQPIAGPTPWRLTRTLCRAPLPPCCPSTQWRAECHRYSTPVSIHGASRASETANRSFRRFGMATSPFWPSSLGAWPCLGRLQRCHAFATRAVEAAFAKASEEASESERRAVTRGADRQGGRGTSEQRKPSTDPSALFSTLPMLPVGRGAHSYVHFCVLCSVCACACCTFNLVRAQVPSPCSPRIV